MGGMSRRWWASSLMMLVALVPACGGGDAGGGTGGGSTAPTFPDSLPPVPKVLTEGEGQKAAPRWEQLQVFTGSGNGETELFSIVGGAIQWRVRWSCETGSLKINATPEATKRKLLVDGSCPKEGEGFAVRTGQFRLKVEASGPWKATVEQQVDTPLNEPPLPGMESAPVLAQVPFYNVDKSGKGTVTVYQLPTGETALRFSEDFEVLNDPDLVVWLSEVPNPKTSAEIVNAPHTQISALKSTRGSQNYVVPLNVPTSKIKSVALYCVPVPSVYIAAALP